MFTFTLSLLTLVSSQTITLPGNIPEACKTKLQEINSSPCGTLVLDFVTTGTLPPIEPIEIATVINTQLSSFCSQECSSILESLKKSLDSQECGRVEINTFNAINITGSDLSTLPKPIQDLFCIKDGNQYCLISQLPTILSLTSTGISQNTLSDKSVICSKCSKLEVDSLSGNMPKLAKSIQDSIGGVVSELKTNQQTCPANSQNGGSGLAGVSLAFLVTLALLM